MNNDCYWWNWVVQPYQQTIWLFYFLTNFWVLLLLRLLWLEAQVKVKPTKPEEDGDIPSPGRISGADLAQHEDHRGVCCCLVRIMEMFVPDISTCILVIRWGRPPPSTAACCRHHGRRLRGQKLLCLRFCDWRTWYIRRTLLDSLVWVWVWALDQSLLLLWWWLVPDKARLSTSFLCLELEGNKVSACNGVLLLGGLGYFWKMFVTISSLICKS